MNNDYASPSDVLKIVENLEQGDRVRAGDRATINRQFNGGRPYTDKEVEENQIQVNVNKLSGYKMALDANMQVDGALMNKDKFFTVRCLVGPTEKRDDWATRMTDNLNKPLKRGRSGRKHLNILKNRNRDLTLHGIGSVAWLNDHTWMPRFVAIGDLLIPSDATTDFSDELGYFGINMWYTPYQLFKLTHGSNVDKGWNVGLVKKILTSIPKVNDFNVDLINRPEEMESLFKQHATFMNSDAVPKVKVSFFFFQKYDGDDAGKWFRRVVFRRSDGINIQTDEASEFLYDSDTVFADHIEEILHVQFGDGNVVAPLKYHSVRGLGILLFAIVEMDNRLYCQTMQHTMEQLMALLRIQSPADKDRPKVVMLNPYGVLEEGISFVPPEERNRADMTLVEFAMAQNRQLMAESSSSYVEDIDTGTQKEQTLGEAQIKLQSANKIVGGMLSGMYAQELFYYEEIMRRFMQKNTGDPDIEAFQKKCRADGIPEEIMKPDAWQIDVEKVFGMGDQTLAIQEVTALMGIINQLEPTAQRLVRRKYIAAITRNPDLAMQLVPEDEIVSSKGRQAAEEVFATLMRGIEVSLREGIEQQDYVIAMTEMMAQEVSRIQMIDNMGTPTDVIGLQTVAQDIDKHMQILAQDPAMKELVTGIGKAVGKLMNDVKGFEQRQQQAAEAEQQNPEELAKIQMEGMKAEAKIQMQAEQNQAKLEAQHQKHMQQMVQSQQRHDQQMRQMEESAEVQIASQVARTQADIEATKMRAEAEPVVA